jgi:hypothetical protein
MAALVMMVTLLPSCTKNQRVKQFGGTSEFTLPMNEKLVNITWKDNNMWYLTRKFRPFDDTVTYHFKEKSSYGLWQGEYIVHEQRDSTTQYLEKNYRIFYDAPITTKK